MDQKNFERAALTSALDEIEPGRTKVLFACRWACPGLLDLPPHVLVIETMCAGRITAAMLIDAVVRGCAGVLVCGCTIDRCHYRFGREHSFRTIERAKGILRLLGLNPEVVQETSCDPSEFHRIVRRLAGRNR
jgi:coenzyme F420-reducing hydrogenase delta subunit